ncbi:hypothetical protein BsWGS_16294 [Bradybaena similaris]
MAACGVDAVRCNGVQLDSECEEDVITRHKKEKKELQAQILKLKHSVTKGDKKKKKDVTDQIAKLEADLEARHKEELANVQDKSHITLDAVKEETVTKKADEDADKDAEVEVSSLTTGKKSKAQKRRDKKQAKGKEREDKIKEQEVISRRGPRQQEMIKIKSLLKQRRLKLYEIPADGNCLYTSVSHQLSIHSSQISTEELRHKTAEYLRSHKDDFLPFLTNPDTGDILTSEEFEKYCDKTAKLPVWGGQVELRALSEILQVPIEVLQADTTPQIIGENMQGKPLILVYHRHVYFLGEHYNSVVPDDQSDETNDGEDEDSGKKEGDSENKQL